MALYEFRCRVCRFVSEHRTLPETRTTVCPACGGDAQRIISAPARVWHPSKRRG